LIGNYRQHKQRKRNGDRLGSCSQSDRPQPGCNQTVYHRGLVAIDLGKALKWVPDWDGSGKRWFKVFIVSPVCEAKVARVFLFQISEWGPTAFRAFIFGKSTFMAKNTS